MKKGEVFMLKNVLEALEKSCANNENKIIFGESEKEITYGNFVIHAKTIGTSLSQKVNERKMPVMIWIDKTIECLETMMGVLYSGNFYTIVDTKSPKERVQHMVDILECHTIITNAKNLSKLEKLELKGINILSYEALIENTIDESRLQNIRDEQIDTDPAYVLFTSGSTGVPKGTVVNHRSILAYTSWVEEAFHIDENTIFGSQTPFYFSMSILDVYTTILTGATLYIIPKMYFSFPVKLIEFVKNKKINTIYWVPSALCIVANLGALNEIDLPDLKKILFAGEVMPVKQLNMWQEALPDCMYANLYGPTETTDICSYYIVKRRFENNETLPIGTHCNNCNLILIKEDGTEAKQGEEGEILVRGTFLADGYYGNEQKTKEAFVQNPLNTKYPEIVYKTGDIGKYNKQGELLYVSRKDYQIKHMGYRIELGEIEKNIYGIDGIVLCAAIYEEQTDQIILFYQGTIEENNLAKQASNKLLPYMRPNKYIKLEKMPYNANGKIDRKQLKQSVTI